jgi:hypothetical protein
LSLWGVLRWRWLWLSCYLLCWCAGLFRLLCPLELSLSLSLCCWSRDSLLSLAVLLFLSLDHSAWLWRWLWRWLPGSAGLLVLSCPGCWALLLASSAVPLIGSCWLLADMAAVAAAGCCCRLLLSPAGAVGCCRLLFDQIRLLMATKADTWLKEYVEKK